MSNQDYPLSESDIKEILAEIWEHSLDDQREPGGLAINQWKELLEDEGLDLPSFDQVINLLNISNAEKLEVEQARNLYESSIKCNSTDVDLIANLKRKAPDIFRILKETAEGAHSEKLALLATAGGSKARTYLKNHPGVDVAIGVGGSATIAAVAWGISRKLKCKALEQIAHIERNVAIEAETDPERLARRANRMGRDLEARVEGGEPQPDIIKSMLNQRAEDWINTHGGMDELVNERIGEFLDSSEGPAAGAGSDLHYYYRRAYHEASQDRSLPYSKDGMEKWNKEFFESKPEYKTMLDDWKGSVRKDIKQEYYDRAKHDFDTEGERLERREEAAVIGDIKVAGENTESRVENKVSESEAKEEKLITTEIAGIGEDIDNKLISGGEDLM